MTGIEEIFAALAVLLDLVLMTLPDLTGDVVAGTEGPFAALAALDLVLIALADLPGELVAGAIALGLRGAMLS